MTIADRRRKVAMLALGHVDQVDIACQLGVGQSTVSRDLAALKAEWRAAAADEVSDLIARECAELDVMERDCSMQFAQDRTTEWISARLAIKKRRADLLGLDAPKRTELTGRDGGPIDVLMSPDFPVIVQAIVSVVPPESRAAVGAALEALGNGHTASE